MRAPRSGCFETGTNIALAAPIFYGLRTLLGRPTFFDYARRSAAWAGALDHALAVVAAAEGDSELANGQTCTAEHAAGRGATDNATVAWYAEAVDSAARLVHIGRARAGA